MKAFKHWFFSWLFPWVPKRLLSRATGLAMRVPLPKFLRPTLIPAFARFFKIAVEEAEFPASHYGSFDAFFTRRLKPGARPLEGDFIHPVDGHLTERGPIAQGQLFQAKGWPYELSDFLGDPALAQAYAGGWFYTYYLCPADYHRIHAPTDGDLTSAKHIPGMLWPVNAWSVGNIRRLFNLNERVVLNFQAPQGRWSMVLVGATNVGYITVSLDPSITTNRWMWHAPTERAYAPALPVKAGDEVGTFHLGSTVICVFDKNFAPSSHPGGGVKMGELL